MAERSPRAAAGEIGPGASAPVRGRSAPEEASRRHAGFTERLAVTLAASLVLASVALAAFVLRAGSESASPAAPAAAAGPLILDPKSLTFALPASDIVLGIAAKPGGPIDLLPRTGAGTALEVAALRATVDGRPADLVQCGPRCRRIETAVLEGAPAAIEVTMPRAGEPAADATFRLPGRLPAAGDRLLRRVNRVMGGLRTLRFRQRLGSRLGDGVEASYTVQAPDRVRIETAAGDEIVIIGDSRWDRPAGRWVRNPYPRDRFPSFPWQDATNPRILGRTVVDGVPVRILALVDRRAGPAWFRLFVEPGGRVVRAEMLAPGHFMTVTYTAFNERLTIRAPRG